MALNLVAYDSSDNDSHGEEEEEQQDNSSQVIVLPKPSQQPETPSRQAEDVGDIPRPSEKELELAEQVRIEKENLATLAKQEQLARLTRKKNGRVVIGIPSIAEFDDEEQEEGRPKKPVMAVGKGSSQLFSVLPLPKNSTYVAADAPSSTSTSVSTSASTSASTEKASPAKKPSAGLIPRSVAQKRGGTKNGSDDEADSGAAGGFFSLDEPELPDAGPSASWALPAAPIETPSHQIPTNELYNLAAVAEPAQQQVVQVEEDVELDETAMQALGGHKRKLPDESEIIEVRGERLTYDPTNSLLKSISEERSSVNMEDFQYSKMQKRKHQITYLAAQAKAQEVDLKNQWAQNKLSRRQTQQKYGF